MSYYIQELEITVELQTGENARLREKNESLRKRLFLNENQHTPPSRRMIRPKIIDPPVKRGSHMGHKVATRVHGEPNKDHPSVNGNMHEMQSSTWITLTDREVDHIRHSATTEDKSD